MHPYDTIIGPLRGHRAQPLAYTCTNANIIDIIEEASANSSFVMVDLERTASLMVGYAVSMSDLVLIPIQAGESGEGNHAATRLAR